MKERSPQDEQWIRNKIENRHWNVSHSHGDFVQGIYRDRGIPRQNINNLGKPVVVFKSARIPGKI